MLPCKEVVRILSSHEDLSWRKRAELRMHLLMCKRCSRYAAHLKIMRQGFRKLFARLTAVDRDQVTHLEDEVLKKLKTESPR